MSDRSVGSSVGQAAVAERVTGKAGRRFSRGLVVEPRFCPSDVADPFETVEWEIRTAAIKGENGEVLFEQTDCEIPAGWSQLATNVVVSKYFYGEVDTPEREKQRPAVDPPRHPHDRRLGRARTATSPRRKTASVSIAT